MEKYRMKHYLGPLVSVTGTTERSILNRLVVLRDAGILVEEEVIGASHGSTYFYSFRSLILLAIGNIMFDLGMNRSIIFATLKTIKETQLYDPPIPNLYEFSDRKKQITMQIDIGKIHKKLRKEMGLE